MSVYKTRETLEFEKEFLPFVERRKKLFCIESAICGLRETSICIIIIVIIAVLIGSITNIVGILWTRGVNQIFPKLT